MNFFEGKSILIISTESWDHIPVSKHHYSIELAAMGARVYFLNLPSNRFSLQKVRENLFLVQCKTIRGINKLPSAIRNFLNRQFIRSLEKICQTSFDIVWTFDPYRFQNLSLFKAKVSLYHAVDVHQAPLERELANTADVIISVADLILERFRFVKARRVKINHGLRAYFLEQQLPLVSAIETIGYVGNLDGLSIDQTTLLRIVEENVDKTFHFIGPYKDDSPLALRLKQFKHCRLFGKQPTEDLPRLFSAIDIFIMVYDGSIKAANSHKILEFLSTGKPAIVNFTDEYKNHRDIVIMSDSNDQLPELVKQVINNPEPHFSAEAVQRRIEFARLNSYRNHIEKIAQLLSAESATKNFRS